jgi:hypothetical protein
MFDWFHWDDFLNGILTEAAGMVADAILIVVLIQWLRRRDENRRLERLRQSTRNMIERTVGRMAYTVDEAINLVDVLLAKQLEVGGDPDITDCPALPNPLSELRRSYEDATRDLADRYSLLDSATISVWEVVLEFTDKILGLWSLQRLSDERITSYWHQVNKRSFMESLAKAPKQLRELKGVLMGVESSLAYAQHLSDQGDRRGASRELVETVHKLRKDPSHIVQGALFAEAFARANDGAS